MGRGEITANRHIAVDRTRTPGPTRASCSKSATQEHRDWRPHHHHGQPSRRNLGTVSAASCFMPQGHHSRVDVGGNLFVTILGCHSCGFVAQAGSVTTFVRNDDGYELGHRSTVIGTCWTCGTQHAATMSEPRHAPGVQWVRMVLLPPENPVVSMKALRKHLGLSLVEARERVRAAPIVLASGRQGDLVNLAESLTREGAHVELALDRIEPLTPMPAEPWIWLAATGPLQLQPLPDCNDDDGGAEWEPEMARVPATHAKGPQGRLELDAQTCARCHQAHLRWRFDETERCPLCNDTLVELDSFIV